MSNTKHTPGPWFVGMSDNATPHILTADIRFIHHVDQNEVDDNLVCILPAEIKKSYNSYANAKLIAAAPTVLAALKQLYDAVKDIPEVKEYLDGNLIEAEDAIKKATT